VNRLVQFETVMQESLLDSRSAAPAPRAMAVRTTDDAARGGRVRLVKAVASFECGGTERQFLALGLALDPERFDLRFACLRRHGPFLEQITARGLEATEYPLRSFFSAGYPWQVWRLARDLSRARAQVVQGYGFYGNVLAVPAARAAGAPVVIASIRDQGVYLTAAQKKVQREICRMADCVLANADSVRDWLVGEGYNPNRIVVIPNGIDLSLYADRVHGARESGLDLRREYGLAPDSPVVAAVARLNPSKGLEHLLDAAASVVARHPGARFLFVGGGPDTAYRASLEARARGLGLADHVIFTGERADVPRILAGVTISVLPSLSEAMPNGVLESMAAGAPVIATRVGGIPEAIEDTRTGLLVPAADPTALAAAINRLLDAPAYAAALGLAGRQTVIQRFSLERMVHATGELYQDLLSRSRPVRRRWNMSTLIGADRKAG
jgi:glycosyltransferase involved in cell wall biosynthesis